MQKIFYFAIFALAARAQDFDLLLTNGKIVDGSGNAWYRADLGIRGGRIQEIGKLFHRKAVRSIDVNGQVIAPGFVDMMGTSSIPLLTDRASAESKLRQGITTMLAGEGGSAAPQNEKTVASGEKLRWRTYAEYHKLLEQRGLAINVIHNVGAAQVRRAVLGDKKVDPTPAQLAEMKQLVAQAMRDGAVGVSTALIYPPGTYASTAELAELAKTAGEYGGMYFTHMRNESSQVLDAIREAMEIGEKAGVPVHIFHLKAAGEDNWPRFKDSVALIQNARDQGRDVTADIYPYIRNGLGIGSFLHPRHYADGSATFLASLKDPALRASLRKEVETTSDWENWYQHVGRNWDNVLVANVGGGVDKKYEGKSVAEIATMRGQDAWTAFFDLVQSGQVSVNPKSMNEEQKHMALRTEWVSVDTDAAPTSITDATGAHPRAFGAFPRVLAKYVREEKVITLEAAVRKMSSLAANRLRLFDRGRIAPGMAADLIVFDPDKVQDTATFTKPLSFATGMPYVIVNGKLEIDNGKFTNATGGLILRAASGR